MNKSLQISSTINCDLLIIGAGGAGFRCAAEVLEKKPDARVIALTKGSHPQKSHTSTAQGGLAAVDPEDPADKNLFHMFDTWKGSDCSADQNVVEKICEAAWDQILWLENRGMHFSRDQNGRLSKRTFGGHTVNFGKASAYRAVFEADRTGKGIMDTCWGETLKRGISFINQCMATELMINENQCSGCIVFNQLEGEFVRVLAKATVLATGGSGQVFKVTTNCRQNTGDGLALILQSGLPVMDPEAVQFHPTGIVGPGILASETLRSVGGILKNIDLEPFMERYAPKMKDLAPRDLVARAMASEIREGRGILNPDHNVRHVWIDLRHLPDTVHEKQIPEVTGFFKKYLNLNPKEELCPVHPSNHYHMGGIPTNDVGEVQSVFRDTIAGLFAVGECAAASFHGFNRLGTNSILELITMGKFAGQRVLDYLENAPDQSSPGKGERSFQRFAQYLQVGGQDSIGQIREALRTLMTEHMSIFRSAAGMRKTIDTINELKQRSDQSGLTSASLRMNQELVQHWELDNLLAIAMTMTRAALDREESRGAHFREDFPERSDDFNYHTLVSMDRFGETEMGRREVDMSLFEAGGKFSDQFGLIERKY
jgi:succinate dehydrogenase / fumarate reductase flavoprotein subunit